MQQRLMKMILMMSTLISFPLFAAHNPCAGPTAMLALVDRPSVADSACVVPYKNQMVEIGYQYQKLLSEGYGQNFPQAVFRVGLPANNEFVLLLPNYTHQNTTPSAGFSAPIVGLKHELGYNTKWLGTIEGLLTLPSGSAAFGSQGLGGTFNGIVTYSFNPEWSLTYMMGVSTLAQSKQEGGQQVTSVNPDFVLAWNKDRTQLYGEIYGQSKPGPQQKSGFNIDMGIIYLVSKHVTFDFEVGQRIDGALGNFKHYIGTGLSVLF